MTKEQYLKAIKSTSSKLILLQINAILATDNEIGGKDKQAVFKAIIKKREVSK